MDPTHFLAAPSPQAKADEAFYQTHGTGFAPFWARLFNVCMPALHRIPRPKALRYTKA